ncbi:MAG: cold-shock protein [Pirellulales bacterium]
MPAGKVKKIVTEKGFGFIRPDDGGADVFFHHSSLVDLQIEEIGMGDSVTFDVEAGRDGKGPRAVNVNKQD